MGDWSGSEHDGDNGVEESTEATAEFGYASWWSRILAGSAALTALPVPIWISDRASVWPYSIIVAIVAIPLFVTPARAFKHTCLTIGCGLFLIGLVGFWAGYFLYLPSALILLACSFADPTRPSRSARLATATVALILLGTSAAWTETFYRSTLETRDIYIAYLKYEVPSGTLSQMRDTLRRADAGYIGDYETAAANGQPALFISFKAGMNGADQARLLDVIQRLSQVDHVERCRGSEC